MSFEMRTFRVRFKATCTQMKCMLIHTCVVAYTYNSFAMNQSKLPSFVGDAERPLGYSVVRNSMVRFHTAFKK